MWNLPISEGRNGTPFVGNNTGFRTQIDVHLAGICRQRVQLQGATNLRDEIGCYPEFNDSIKKQFEHVSVSLVDMYMYICSGA